MLDFSDLLHIGFLVFTGALILFALVFSIVLLCKKRYTWRKRDSVLAGFNIILLIIFLAFFILVALIRFLPSVIGFKLTELSGDRIGLSLFGKPRLQYPVISFWTVLFGSFDLAANTLMGFILTAATAGSLLLLSIIHAVKAKKTPKEKTAAVPETVPKKERVPIRAKKAEVQAGKKERVSVRVKNAETASAPAIGEPVVDYESVANADEPMAEDISVDSVGLHNSGPASYGVSGEHFSEQFLKKLDEDGARYSFAGSAISHSPEELDALINSIDDEINSASTEVDALEDTVKALESGVQQIEKTDYIDPETVLSEDAVTDDGITAEGADGGSLSDAIFDEARKFAYEIEEEEATKNQDYDITEAEPEPEIEPEPEVEPEFFADNITEEEKAPPIEETYEAVKEPPAVVDYEAVKEAQNIRTFKADRIGKTAEYAGSVTFHGRTVIKSRPVLPEGFVLPRAANPYIENKQVNKPATAKVIKDAPDKKALQKKPSNKKKSAAKKATGMDKFINSLKTSAKSKTAAKNKKVSAKTTEVNKAPSKEPSVKKIPVPAQTVKRRSGVSDMFAEYLSGLKEGEKSKLQNQISNVNISGQEK